MHAGTDRITKLITTRHARALCAYIAYSSLQYHLLGTCSRDTSVVSASKAVNSAALSSERVPRSMMKLSALSSFERTSFTSFIPPCLTCEKQPGGGDS